jgi:alkylhydroperoxidase family enzyme
VPVWRETPFFTPRERAALAWTEAVTQISTHGAPDELHAALSAQFTPREQMDLTLAISMINCWNRLAIAFRKMPDA